MSLTNFPNGITSYGVPVMGGNLPATYGKVWFVDYDNGSDNNNGESAEQAFKTVAVAYAAARTNKNDIIALSAYGTHVLTSMLDVTKNRVHFIGFDPVSRLFGQGVKISLTATAGATNIATIKNTGVRNSFTNIKFINASTVAEGIYCVAEGGEYTVYKNCEFYKSTDLDVTGAAEVLNNGDSAQWIGCTFGSSADETSGAITRATMLVTATLAGKKCRDNVILDSIFLKKAGHVNNRFIYGANATDVERMFYIDRTLFFSNPLGAATPALAVDFGSAQTEGAVVLGSGCSSVDVTALAATGEGIYTLAPSSPTYATSGKSVAS